MTDKGKDAAHEFITRWSGVTASELSTAQSFALDLCRLLDVPAPHPDAEQQYMFERPITFAHGDGSTSAGRIDLYKRGCFVLEAKKVKAATHTRGFDDALLRARAQAEQYARALPASESRPPFLIVVDVGNRIELYSEFSRSGATYTPFPDPRSHRIALADLANADIRERLRRIWTDPLALDPARVSARVTREIAARLAELAKSLERAKHSPEAVAQFLMRCLFTMFAEDVGLLPADAFLTLLTKHKDEPDVAMRMLGGLWRDMDQGGFSIAIAADVLRFNGKLFKAHDTLPLNREQIALLIEAAKAKWEHVEPAIFGTLLERALDSAERDKLGAHYTPRAYVERLVLPTIIEPLRKEWEDVKAAALLQITEAEQARDRGLGSEGLKSPAERLKQSNIELRKARDLILGFHKRLCTLRVLDPACGTGNFLYVALEHLKRLEGEVLNALEEFGLSRLGVTEQTQIDVEGTRVIAEEAQTVDPHNLLGIEVNPRAAAIAEVVLWIGYLQWHYRTRGNINPPQPVVRDFRNIECRDAVLAYDTMEYVSDERGVPVTRWDGKTYKKSPVTGEDIPDDSARVPLERYVNPRKAAWPQADFVVGNPPFIGASNVRRALGDGYADALRTTWPEVPESADFVMHWWHHAAQLTRRHALQRFGFITTNSIRQTFNRRVIEAALLVLPYVPPAGDRVDLDFAEPYTPPAGNKVALPLGEVSLSLAFAIPDHPWVDAADGAAVRIAMTVGVAGASAGRLLTIQSEKDGSDDEVAVTFRERSGIIHADLSVGADVAATLSLSANAALTSRGLMLFGAGFIINPAKAQELLTETQGAAISVIRPYRNGRDLADRARGVMVIDLYGMDVESVRTRIPAIYQHVLAHVKPKRDQNRDKAIREAWWLHGRSRPEIREALAGLKRYIATAETAKHRTFQFLDASIAPDNKLIVIALSDATQLGILSSEVHVRWALAAGSRLGVGNDPVYVKTRCFETFPFPASTPSDADALKPSHSRGGLGGDGVRDGSFATQHHPPPTSPLKGEALTARIRNLAEQLDAHRKRQQAAHADLTLTGMYNVLEKLRSGEALSAKERTIHEHGLVSVLRQLHDELDAAVLDAYGWSDLLPLLRVAHGNRATPSPPNPPLEGEGLSCMDAKRAFDEAILERLVALNAERAAEEARGLVRWLRPDFQNPSAQTAPQQAEMETGTDDEAAMGKSLATAKPLPWPKDTLAQVRAIADLLAAAPVPLSIDDIAARYSARGPWKKRLPQLLETLVALGRVRELTGRYSSH